jgi:PAS domain S-box-containing protein
VAVRDEAGRLAGVVSVNRDVTERHRAERALRESEERLQQILEATDASVWEFDLETREAHPGSRYVRAFGETRGVPSLDAALALVHPDDAARVEVAMSRHLAGETALYEAEFRVRSPSGEWRRLHARGKVVRGDDGRPLRLAGTAVDVTEHHHLREQLVLSERMASLGTLAAGTAHEINNPLSFITANLAFVEEELHVALDLALAGETAELEPVRRELADALAEARDGAERVRVIVRDLRAFSRGDDGVRAPVDVAHVVRGAARIAHREIEERARLAVDVEGVPPVLGNAAPLGQVVLNLLVNAAQAIGPGAPDRNEVRIAARADGDARVALTVSDTGCGIPPSVLPRIFDPFFTTKAPGEGTGLGLAICHALVAGMGGEIRVESEPGRGATFTVVLRRAPAGQARSNTSTSATPVPPPATSTAASPSIAAPSPARSA